MKVKLSYPLGSAGNNLPLDRLFTSCYVQNSSVDQSLWPLSVTKAKAIECFFSCLIYCHVQNVLFGELASLIIAVFSCFIWRWCLEICWAVADLHIFFGFPKMCTLPGFWQHPISVPKIRHPKEKTRPSNWTPMWAQCKCAPGPIARDWHKTIYVHKLFTYVCSILQIWKIFLIKKYIYIYLF